MAPALCLSVTNWRFIETDGRIEPVLVQRLPSAYIVMKFQYLQKNMVGLLPSRT